MTVEPGHDPTEWVRGPRPASQPIPAASPVQYNAARHGSHVEESPELLRWRADLLMDEMMMGGVDVSAADGNRTFSGVDAPVIPHPQPSTNGSPANGSPANGYGNHENGSYSHGGHSDNSLQSNSTRPNGTYSNGQPHSSETQHPTSSNGGTSPSSSSPSSSGREPYTDPYGSESPRNLERRSLEERNDAPLPREHRVDEGGNGRYTQDHSTNRFSDEPLRQPPTRPSPPTSPNTSSYETQRPDQGASRYPMESQNRESQNRIDDDASLRGSPASSYSTQPAPEPLQREGVPRPNLSVDESSPYPSMLRTTMDGAPAISSGEQTPRTDRLYSVEQQYEQFRREQSANIRPVEPEPPSSSPPSVASNMPPTRPPLPPVEPPRQQATPPRVAPQAVDEHTRWATGADKWEYQDYGTDPAAAEEVSLLSGYPAPERRPPNSAVRHDPTQFVNAMSVAGSGKKRSTLLPRSSELDIDTLHREISDLHGEIAALLPIGNETGERARHLLDKAYSILQSDPMRSAEVEYYMQQVRTIVQRLYQARKWSDLYRQRLHVYLLGWVGLSAVMLVARFLFQHEIELALMWLLGILEEHILVAHWATLIGTAFAGALGGAVGALYTMQAHARSEYSFFDRKYGLRGLILPFMGLIVGGLGYLIFGLIFALVGIDPSQNLTAAIVPTTTALAFGFSQESIYGTRN